MGKQHGREGWIKIHGRRLQEPTLGPFDATVKGVRAIALSPVSWPCIK